MDAARLVAEAERAMRGSSRPEDVIAEAWQAYELTEAVGRLLGGRRGSGGPAGETGGLGGPEVWGGSGDQGVGYGAGAGAGSGPGVPCGPVDGAEGVGPTVRAEPAPVATATGAGPPRALRLTGVRDPDATVRALRDLLGEIGAALVEYVCTAAGEEAYWQCIEALDALDEAKDRVRVLADPDPDPDLRATGS